MANVQRISARDLARLIPGTHQSWWERRLPRLRALGLVTKRGRYHFADVERLRAALIDNSIDLDGGAKVIRLPGPEAA